MAVHARTMSTGAQLLRRTLQLDGAVCLMIGVPTAAAAGPVAAFMGIPSPLAVGGLGVVLAAYGAMLITAARQEPVDRRAALGSTMLDLLWVIASIGLLASDLMPLTDAGWWTVLLLMLAVAGIADAKLWAWWRSR